MPITARLIFFQEKITGGAARFARPSREALRDGRMVGGPACRCGQRARLHAGIWSLSGFACGSPTRPDRMVNSRGARRLAGSGRAAGARFRLCEPNLPRKAVFRGLSADVVAIWARRRIASGRPFKCHSAGTPALAA
jgi:hypothetical protein